MKYTSVAVMLLINGSEAVKIQREPLFSAPHRNDWAFETAKKTGPDHPVDYFVPDFGVDKEIKNTQKSISDAEALKNHELTFKQGPPPPDHPKDYYVPDFGVDHDVKITLNNAGAAEKQFGHWDATKEAPELHPMDYFVPNFGTDKEIITTQKSIRDMEKSMNHELTFKSGGPPPPDHPKDYYVPDFGVDHDVKTTLNNAGAAEKQYGHFWDATKKAPEPHPVDYFVPNFGKDKVMITTEKSIRDAENLLNHKLVIATKPAPEPPRDYAVPNFGMDHDIKDSLHHLDSQESKHGTWNIASLVQLDESAKREPLLSNLNTQKWKGKYPINYFVPNFGKDSDLVASDIHTEAAEKRLSHKWEPYQEENDDGEMEWQRIPGFFTLNGRSN